MLRFTPKNSSQGYGGPATLFAFDPVSAALLYDSDQAGSRDMPPNSIKFATPIVANGKVYFGTATELDVFGLLSPKASAAQTRRTVARTAGSPQVDSRPGIANRSMSGLVESVQLEQHAGNGS